jgi:hypothetical protein
VFHYPINAGATLSEQEVIFTASISLVTLNWNVF